MASISTSRPINLAQLTYELGSVGLSMSGFGDSEIREIAADDVDEEALVAAIEAHVAHTNWVHPSERIATPTALTRKVRAVAAGDEEFTPAQTQTLIATSYLRMVDLQTKAEVAASDLNAVKTEVFGAPSAAKKPVLTVDPALTSNPILAPGRL